MILATTEGVMAMALLSVVAAESNEESSVLPSSYGLVRVAAVVAVFLFCMYSYDLYDSVVVRSLREGLTHLLDALGTTFLVLAGLYLIAPSLRLRLASLLVGMSLVGLGVVVARNLYVVISRSPRLAERFVLVGNGLLAQALSEEIERRPELGLRLLGSISAEPSPSLRWLGKPSEWRSVVEQANANGVIVGTVKDGDRLEEADFKKLKAAGLKIIQGIELYEAAAGKLWLAGLDGAELKSLQALRISRVQLAGMRMFSVVFSLAGLLLAGPLMGLIALLIRLDSGGPVIFRQQRVGQNGKLFTLYKFRSMHSEAVNGRFRPAEENDQRLTRVGRWLRRTRLDELPQLYNILRGEMSFIGPRPFAWEEEREWARQIPFYTHRWTVKPGATGWAQVNRGYCATLEDNIDKLAYDLFYVKNLSAGLDALIFLQTVKTLLQGRGAR
jgi:exopolysaccharide biosynthesis polyprenyl glycosylphosphotransferase